MPFDLPERKSLTKTQTQIINDLNSRINREFAVVGGPGTGKTVLAIHGINDIIQKGEKAVFLVYNKPLSQFIEESIKKNNSSLNNRQTKQSVKTWGSWLFGMLARHDSMNLVDQSTSNWNYNWPEIIKYANEHKNEFSVDTIFIDEAQDLPSELFEVIKLLSNKRYIYFDSNQQINDTNNSFMVGGLYSVLTCLDLEEKFYDLTENYRNTVQIEKLAKIFGNNYTANSITLNKYTATRNGEKPILYKSSSIQDTVNNIIDFYLNHPNTFISVLMPRMSSGYKDLFMAYKTAFEEAISKSNRKPNFFYYFGGEKNVPNFEKSGIYLMTFKNSKGLEFDYVYLIEMNNANACLTQSIDRNGVYVALTRARENAFIVYNPKEDINSLISLMFDAKVQDDSIFEEKDIKSANTVRKVFI